MLVLCDIDGVIADPCNLVKKYLLSRPKNWEEFYEHTHEVPEIKEVIELVMSLYRSGHWICFCTGRPERVREQTNKYLLVKIPILASGTYTLRMRKNRDHRPSYLLKLEACTRYQPNLVLEDEPETVKRLSSAGYCVLQVHGHRVETTKTDLVPDVEEVNNGQV